MTNPGLDLRAHTGRNYAKGRPVIWQIMWQITSHAIFQRWWLPGRLRPPILRAFGAEVGNNVVIRQDVRIHWPWRLTIHGPAWIGHGAWILNLAEVVIEHDVCLSQEAMLCTGSHDRNDTAFEHANAPIRIGAGAWICTRAVVLPGTTVGDHAIVTAGSVVRGVVERSTVAASTTPRTGTPEQSGKRG